MTRRERRKQQHQNRQRAAADPRPASSAAVPETPEHPTAASPENSGPTGPRTPEGKAVSSRNASKHNLCAQRLTGTDLAEYTEIRAALAAEWSPSSQTEHFLLDQMALSQWRIGRALDIELAAFSPEGLDAPLLSLALRYRTAAERAYYKALTELQRYRANFLQELKAEAQAAEAEIRRHFEARTAGLQAHARAPEFVSQTAPTRAAVPRSSFRKFPPAVDPPTLRRRYLPSRPPDFTRSHDGWTRSSIMREALCPIATR